MNKTMKNNYLHVLNAACGSLRVVPKLSTFGNNMKNEKEKIESVQKEINYFLNKK